MSKKKSYNPFKMWGSWVGVIIVYVIRFMESLPDNIKRNVDFLNFNSEQFNILMKEIGESFVSQLGFSIKIEQFFEPIVLFFTIVFMILGFLIGWGIHSLIRRLRRWQTKRNRMHWYGY